MAKLSRSFRYRAFNLCISSNFEIPGAQLLDDTVDGSAAELTIISGSTQSLSGDVRSWGPYTVSANELLFELPDVAKYTCTAGGTQIAIETFAGVKPLEVSEYLIATALPAALWMRGNIVLHAAGCVLAGERGALAFAGVSGSGKSSVLQELLTHEACIVADDSLRLDGTATAMQVSGLPASLFLRREGNRLDAERDRFAVPPQQQQPFAPLAAVVVLDDRGASSATRLLRLSPGQALEALLQHRHRASVPHLLGLDALLLPRFAELASTVPVYLWSRRPQTAALAPDELRALQELCGDHK